MGNWRWAFWAFVLQSVLFMVACLLFMPQEQPNGIERGQDFPSTRLLVLCLSLVSVALAGVWTGVVVSTLFCLLGAFLLWLVFVLDAKPTANRLFPSQPLNPTITVGAGLLFVFSASIATMSFLVYGPLLLETIHGLTPLTAGYVVAFESIALGLGAVAVARWAADADVVFIRTGSLLITAGIIGFALGMSHGPVWLLLLCAGCQGLGFGISWGFIAKRITANAIPAEKDVASSAVPTIQQIGFAFGAAAVGNVANLVGFGDSVTVATAAQASPWIFVSFLPFGLVAIFAAWRMTNNLTRL